MYLPLLAHGAAVGLFSLALLAPLQLLGAKLLWWTWHASHPLSGVDRFLGLVPWNELIALPALAASFAWALELSQRALLSDVYNWKKSVLFFDFLDSS
jgi:hypothetical protein